ncbi:MAG: PAS domain-containing sensor histidine kinase [Bacteroidota bacterium]|nr:PAS domain-containing sensor histidine kinase [Bacteroidota bacterium]
MKEKAGRNPSGKISPFYKSIFTPPGLKDTDMKRELEMLNSLFEYATEGIIICNTAGEIRLANPAAERMFGYEKEELKGKAIEVLIPMRHKHAHVQHRDGYVKKPTPRSMGAFRDLFGVRKDGSEIMVEVSLSPFETGEGKFIMSFIVDITQRKKSEIELRVAHERQQQATDALSRLNAELESKVRERTEELAVAIQRLAQSKGEVMRALKKEKELNELKSRFITTASHEFRTPLGTILSSVSLIARYEETADVEKRKKHIERIKSSVTNLTEILNDFLSLEKLEEGIIRCYPERFDFLNLVNELIGDMRNIAKQGQTITLGFSGEREIFLDHQLLKNALLNLFSNAIKYSPEHKPIVVDVTIVSGQLKIDIEDKGIGIPEEDQPNIFERFYRAKNSGNIQGTGLGLNIVKKYIELMNGTISFASTYNEGTTFTVKIPLTENISQPS